MGIYSSARNRTHQSLSYAGQPYSVMDVDLAVNVLPPTPLRDDKTVRFIGKTRPRTDPRVVNPPTAPQPPVRRTTLSQPEVREASAPQSNVGAGDQSFKTPRSALRNKVHLPDVTGLTSAVASPARRGWEYYGVNTNEEREADGECSNFFNFMLSMTLMVFSPPHRDSEHSAIETCSPRSRE